MITCQDTLLILIIIIILLVLYILFKKHVSEPFTVTDDINQAINDIYKADVNAIRNLSNFASEIKNNNDSFTIPAKITSVSNMNMTGDLTVNGNVKFTNKNNIMEILPSGIVIAWALNSIPKGWALCDGKKYIINSDGNVSENSTGIQTPDLRGRFVLGSGSGGKDMNNELLSERVSGITGGEEKHTLTLREIPGHTHNLSYPYVACAGGGCLLGSGSVLSGVVLGTYEKMTSYSYRDPNALPRITSNTGGTLRPSTGTKADGAIADYTTPAAYDTTPHNIMPPFYTLTYIMKI